MLLTKKQVSVVPLARMSFAVAINKLFPGLTLDESKIVVDLGDAVHYCSFETEDGILFRGCFYFRKGSPKVNRTVCVGMVDDLRSKDYFLLLFNYRPTKVRRRYKQMKGRPSAWTRGEILNHARLVETLAGHSLAPTLQKVGNN